MRINKYATGLFLIFIGFLAIVCDLHFIGAFVVGIGFILVLKSYVK